MTGEGEGEGGSPAAARDEPAAASSSPSPPDAGSSATVTTFSCKQCYVYALPAGMLTASGHRAELWGLDKWIEVVACRVVEGPGDVADVRLEELEVRGAEGGGGGRFILPTPASGLRDTGAPSGGAHTRRVKFSCMFGPGRGGDLAASVPA